jgi:hypothetical protein
MLFVRVTEVTRNIKQSYKVRYTLTLIDFLPSCKFPGTLIGYTTVIVQLIVWLKCATSHKNPYKP